MKLRTLTCSAAAILLTVSLSACGPKTPAETTSAAPVQTRPAATPSPKATPAPTAPATPAPALTPSPTPGPTETKAGILSAFTAVDLDGYDMDQSMLEGYKLTMVNIWATYCSNCLGEMPNLGALHGEYSEKGIQVVGIVTDVLNRDGSVSEDQVATAKDVVASTGASYVHLMPSEDLRNILLSQVQAVPTTFFVDADGNQVGETYLGARSKADWSAIMDGLLDEVSP